MWAHNVSDQNVKRGAAFVLRPLFNVLISTDPTNKGSTMGINEWVQHEQPDIEYADQRAHDLFWMTAQERDSSGYVR